MDAAVAALIGAGIGSFVPAVAMVMDNRANRADARAGRMFDHRRAAYAAFVTEGNPALDAAFDWYNVGRPQGEPPDSALSELYERLVDVQLHGTAAAGQAAQSAYDAVTTYVHRSESDANMLAARAAIEEFIAHGRDSLA